jgi:catechol 2,3-dioxygenase-like lactoylglutathione lyase family enzyme
MDACIDHIVLWVNNPMTSLKFYEQVIGLNGVRVEEFKAGKAPFLSVRVSPESIIDLMSHSSAPGTENLTKAPGSAAHPVNHLCLAMSKMEYDALSHCLEANSVDTQSRMHQTFGARGLAPEAFYFKDPDGNVIEARYYSHEGNMSTHRH